MTARLIYVESHKLYVMLLDSKIFQIQKTTDPHINPHATCVDRFDATLGPTHIVDREPYPGSQSALALDAADITTFAAWLGSQMPNASTNAFGKAMFGYFPGSMQFRDVLIASGRAAAVPGMKRPNGEELYFMDRARASDPTGFAELAAAYATGAANIQIGARTVSQR
ncbi:hypothetical protein [Mesorhizobium sp. B2-3-5]|uniref:hypothetical protein n=1 Tax=Mesorhizobium sp. B2-3-5 TaxID=2589958 RepID=UPI00112D7108|nr:hypothetical protein [Mesorhizobium sp. B2-3-5]TPM21637.1 hypothetical protein FJ958_26010 [Mesorhizobium sp. B2-3-5]